jgi:hypothetical protein
MLGFIKTLYICKKITKKLIKNIVFTLIALVCFTIVNAQEQEADSEILKNGFGVETFIGNALTDYSSGDIGVGIKLANYWYFGDSATWRPGLKSTWFRGATYFGDDVLTLQGSVLNVGFANAFDFGNNIGLGVNLNVGYNVVVAIFDDTTPTDDFAGGGILFNPEIKFRYNVLAIGLDFAFTKVTEYTEQEYYNGFDYEYYTRDTPFSSINFTIGAKF